MKIKLKDSAVVNIKEVYTMGKNSLCEISFYFAPLKTIIKTTKIIRDLRK